MTESFIDDDYWLRHFSTTPRAQAHASALVDTDSCTTTKEGCEVTPDGPGDDEPTAYRIRSRGTQAQRALNNEFVVTQENGSLSSGSHRSVAALSRKVVGRRESR